MEKFTVYTGTTVPLMNDNIDTDQILPKQFLKLIDKKALVSTSCMLGDIWTISILRIQTLSLTDLNIAKPVFSFQGITSAQALQGTCSLGSS